MHSNSNAAITRKRKKTTARKLQRMSPSRNDLPELHAPVPRLRAAIAQDYGASRGIFKHADLHTKRYDNKKSLEDDDKLKDI